MTTVTGAILLTIGLIIAGFIQGALELPKLLKLNLEERRRQRFAERQADIDYASYVADIIYRSSPDHLWKYTGTSRADILEMIRNKRKWTLIQKTSDELRKEGKDVTEAAIILGAVIRRYCTAQASVM